MFHLRRFCNHLVASSDSRRLTHHSTLAADSMSLGSQNSALDPNVLTARERTTREPPTQSDAHAKPAETDFVAVGALFGDRRGSDPRPNLLELSEGEENFGYPLQKTRRDELFFDVDAVVSGNAVPSRSPATPTPTQPHFGSYIQPSDMPQLREQRKRKRRRGRKHNRGTFLLVFLFTVHHVINRGACFSGGNQRCTSREILRQKSREGCNNVHSLDVFALPMPRHAWRRQPQTLVPFTTHAPAFTSLSLFQ